MYNISHLDFKNDSIQKIRQKIWQKIIDQIIINQIISRKRIYILNMIKCHFYYFYLSLKITLFELWQFWQFFYEVKFIRLCDWSCLLNSFVVIIRKSRFLSCVSHFWSAIYLLRTGCETYYIIHEKINNIQVVCYCTCLLQRLHVRDSRRTP